jgi:DNA processing protein
MKFVTTVMSEYPGMLRSYDKHPKAIYYDGDVSLFNSKCIAVIGTREPSKMGLQIAFAIAKYFSEQGYTIVSGLAKGIDTAAHRGALAGSGKTIAILASPLYKIYPRENSGLASDIIAHGGLIYTEYNDLTPSGNFVNLIPRLILRDYLQAAQSLAVIPVQAGSRSGTRHAVDGAVTLNRPLFIPKPVASDLKAYPEKYVGLRQYAKNGLVFSGRDEYSKLIEILEQL